MNYSNFYSINKAPSSYYIPSYFQCRNQPNLFFTERHKNEPRDLIYIRHSESTHDLSVKGASLLTRFTERRYAKRTSPWHFLQQDRKLCFYCAGGVCGTASCPFKLYTCSHVARFMWMVKNTKKVCNVLSTSCYSSTKKGCISNIKPTTNRRHTNKSSTSLCTQTNSKRFVK